MGWGVPGRQSGVVRVAGVCLVVPWLLYCSTALPPVSAAPDRDTGPHALAAAPVVVPVHETEDVCPYTRAMLDWWPRKPQADGSRVGLSARVLSEFGARLLQRGFVLVEGSQHTYWTVNAIARESVTDREMAHGYIRMAAIADFDGKPVRYDFQTRGELRDAGVLFELPESELDAQIRELADSFAERLTPHARRMCADWASGLPAEQARLERIRKELVTEIERVKRTRRDPQDKQLELGTGAPDGRLTRQP